MILQCYNGCSVSRALISPKHALFVFSEGRPCLSQQKPRYDSVPQSMFIFAQSVLSPWFCRVLASFPASSFFSF